MKSHWIITYVLANDTRIQESSRECGLDPMTEDEVKDGIASSLQKSSMVYVRDHVRGGAPTLLFMRHIICVELDRDGDPEPDLAEEGKRHLELVLTDTAEEVPGPPELGTVQDLQGHRARRWPFLPYPAVPAGPDRFA